MHLHDCNPPESLRMPSEKLLKRTGPRFRVFVVSSESKVSKDISLSLSRLLSDGDGAFSDVSFIPVTAKNEEIAYALRRDDVESALDSLRVSQSEAPGFFDIFVFRVSDSLANPCMHIGKKRTAWIVSSDYESDNIPFVAAMVRMVSKPVLKCWESTQKRFLESGSQYIEPAEEYVFSFTLMFEDGGVDSQGRPIEWDFVNVSQKYINPLRLALFPHVKTMIRSDILRYASINADVNKATKDNDEIVHTIEQSSVPFMLEPREEDWHIDRSSTRPLVDDARRRVVNFVVLVPSAEHAPLYFAGNKNEPFHDSIFIDDFGAVYILNKKSEKLDVHALSGAFKSFVAHIREMFGFNSDYVSAEDAVQIEYRGSGGILVWETDAFVGAMVRYAVERSEMLYAAFQKERALKRYILVENDVCYYAGQAQSKLDGVKTLDANGAENAWSALADIEYATGLPSTTFVADVPDEHLYALYLPLFVPIIVQLFGVTKLHITHTMHKRRQAEEEKKDKKD